MGLFHTQKPKSAAKVMIPRSERLQNTVEETLAVISSMVGITLGPGGRQILIERPEMNMKPLITKDGVTVIKNLGFHDSVKQLLLESVRDAALRTASEAGDGTTTATILSNAIAREIALVAKNNPKVSPQMIVRQMHSLLPQVEKKLRGLSTQVAGKNYEEVLAKVADLSANGDSDLAAAVMEGFNLVGEEGNLTIIEEQGESRYKVTKIEGYPIEIGYEDTCKGLSPLFINDPSGTMVVAKNPIFVLFDGVITDTAQILESFNRLSDYLRLVKRHDREIVLVAHGFADSVVGDLQINWSHPESELRIMPLKVPPSITSNGGTAFLFDLQSYVGCPVFNPITKPLADLDPAKLVGMSRATKLECGRFRSTVEATADEFLLEARIAELKLQKAKPESDYELRELNVRIGKLTSGIAKLTVYGPTAGETREKRDRADDAWCAIRGAVKNGVLPGGGYALVQASASLVASAERDLVLTRKLAATAMGIALLEPVRCLYRNYGFKKEEDISEQISKLLTAGKTYNILTEQWVELSELPDSFPAVMEAIRNSLSIASLLGTLGGVVAFLRDSDADQNEQKLERSFMKAIGED